MIPSVFGLGESGDGIIDTFTAINTGTTPLTATITVTPTYSNLGLGAWVNQKPLQLQYIRALK